MEHAGPTAATAWEWASALNDQLRRDQAANPLTWLWPNGHPCEVGGQAVAGMLVLRRGDGHYDVSVESATGLVVYWDHQRRSWSSATF
jgi:hypothetical protein